MGLTRLAPKLFDACSALMQALKPRKISASCVSWRHLPSRFSPHYGDLISAFAATPWPAQQIPLAIVHATHDNATQDL
jgi:hypothetical protein